VFESLGIGLAEAASIRRVRLQFARSGKTFPLPGAALGISRHLLDLRMMSRARELGAEVRKESSGEPSIVAHGRKDTPPKGKRIFGFKTHFRGAANDAVELYFFRGGYVGVNPVDSGLTNVCGLLPENELLSDGFDLDQTVEQFVPLRERLQGLERAMPWLKTGPLVFDKKTNRTHEFYVAGDALAFVDPFTGSGMLSALVTGRLAGESAARRLAIPAYLAECERLLGTAYRYSTVIREALASSWAEGLMPWVPGSLLFRFTRPAAR
jgi:flavin-dependent dehydrogenase